MHISQEDFNLLLDQKLDHDSRLKVTDHILDCEPCAAKFRALNELHQTMQAPQRKTIPLRYVLGVAAVWFMAFSPFLTKTEDPNQASAPTLAQMDQASDPQNNNPSLNLLQQVDSINFTHALDEWGKQKSMTDLIAMQNRG